jgi:hypothetical protein
MAAPNSIRCFIGPTARRIQPRAQPWVLWRIASCSMQRSYGALELRIPSKHGIRAQGVAFHQRCFMVCLRLLRRRMTTWMQISTKEYEWHSKPARTLPTTRCLLLLATPIQGGTRETISRYSDETLVIRNPLLALPKKAKQRDPTDKGWIPLDRFEETSATPKICPQ